MEPTMSFGYWVRRRRKALDLTQVELAQRVGCAPGTIRHIEADERRPSRQLAERLVNYLEVPADERAAFLKTARAELAVDQLAMPSPPSYGTPSNNTTRASDRRLSSEIVEHVPRPGLPGVPPSGTVTFLFTDIEGSTKLWEQHKADMRGTIARHDILLQQAIEAHGGSIFKTVGDAICAAFARAPDALAAAISAQRALHNENWGPINALRVRMALHTGVAEERNGDYFGPPLNRAARLMATGHGSQILLTRTTQELVRDDLTSDVELRDLGMHRLKDLIRPEQVFQVVTPDLPAAFPLLNALDARPHNLPLQPTSLIGREVEVAQVCDLLRRADVRLVTLTGPGGVGKTRLALQSAVELLDDFADGVWFVNLAPITEPAFVVNIITQTLGVRESSSQTLLDTLKTFLRVKQALLLVDNFEHIVEAAPLLAELLAPAPSLKVLVTSRMPLHLSGEREFAVPPLAQPDRTQPVELERLSQYDAVRLFIDRAQAVKPNFTVTNATAPAVAEICYRLDGLPLAIELAAARAKLFPLEALLVRLSSRLKFLTGVVRNLPVRQQTIRNTIAWSYHLLDKDEKTLFTRLGVFVGGCTLEAAEAVCNTDGDLPMEVVEGIAALLDKSLLRQEEGSDGEPRVTMLETIREYALERMAERGEADAIRQQHATYFLKFAEEYDPWPRIHAPPQELWLDRLEAEHENLRAASGWFAEQDEAEHGVRLAGALVGFWTDRFHWDEGRAWLEAALARSGNVSVVARAKAVLGTSWLAFRLGDFITARTYIEEGLALFRGLSDKAAIALAVLMLGSIALGKGEYAMAHACAEECLALFQEVSDQWGRALAVRLLGGIAVVQGGVAQTAIYNEEILTSFRQIGDKRGIGEFLIDKGIFAQLQDEWEQAVACYAESLVIFRELGAKEMTAAVLHNLGGAVLHQGDARRAAACFAEGLALNREIGARHGIAMNLAGMAGVAIAQAQPARSARLLGSAEALLEAIGIAPDPADRADYDRIRTAVRAQLDEATFAAAWTEGQAMSLEQAVAHALSTGD